MSRVHAICASLGRFRRCPGTGDGTFGSWQFRGARVVRAVLKKLKGRLESGKRPVPICQKTIKAFECPPN